MSPEAKNVFLEHIELLIAFSIITIGFQSRSESEKKLRIRDGQLLEKALIADLDPICQRYFDDLIEIKDNIRFMHLEENDHDAWKTLHKDQEAYFYVITTRLAKNLSSKIMKDPSLTKSGIVKVASTLLHRGACGVQKLAFAKLKFCAPNASRHYKLIP